MDLFEKIQKLRTSNFFLVNIVLCLLGIIVVLLGSDISNQRFNALSQAIGIGLISSGLVNSIRNSFTYKQEIEGIKMLAANRTAMSSNFHNLRYKASKIDIAGVSLTDCLKELVNSPNKKIFTRMLTEGIRFRLLFLHPDSPSIDQRAKSDGITSDALKERQKASVALCIEIYNKLKRNYNYLKKTGNLERNLIGDVQIKLIDFFPNITIERYDDTICWGFYLAQGEGRQAPVFEVTKDQNYVVFDSLKLHFDGLLKLNLDSKDNEEFFLVKMVLGDPPILNTKLAAYVLGADKMNELLNPQE